MKLSYYKVVSKSNLCDCNDAYILVMADITIVAVGDRQVTQAFKNCAPFTKCITKMDGTRIDYSEELDLIMLMHNLLE